jgi:dUTP pyrophosphatase
MTIKVKRLSPDVFLPEYATDGSSGLDVRAYITKNNIDEIIGENFTRFFDIKKGLLTKLDDKIILKPLGRALIPTGLFVEIPCGFEIQVRPRSGLAIKHGITVLNTPGTIDSDYRGEIKVILFNTSSKNYIISHGDKISQLVVQKVERAEFVEVDELVDTVRSAGGFGSTG